MGDNASRTIAELIHYISEFDPSYPDSLQGAPAEQIHELERWVGRPLPAFYREFLVRMGMSTGGLQLDEGDFSIEAVLEYYRNEEWPHPAHPAHYLFIAQDRGMNSMDVWLECAPPQGTEPWVVRFSGQSEVQEDQILVEAPSFRDYVFRWAVAQYRMSKALLPFQDWLMPSKRAGYLEAGWSQQAHQRLKDISLKLGFKQRDLTGPWVHYYERGDAVLMVHLQAGHSLLGVATATQEEAESKRLAEIFFENIRIAS